MTYHKGLGYVKIYLHEFTIYYKGLGYIKIYLHEFMT
jgi:hypothetical protein